MLLLAGCVTSTVKPVREYKEFSKRIFDIYCRYTDLVEPFGIDECWLDVTGCLKSPMEIAEEIGISQAQVSRLEKQALKEILNNK